MPTRTCLACSRVDEKGKLLKFVLELTHSQYFVVGDSSKTKEGRGYYLHKTVKCLCSQVGWKRIVGKANSLLTRTGISSNVNELKVDNIKSILESFLVSGDEELGLVITAATKELGSVGDKGLMENKKLPKVRSVSSMLPGHRIKLK